MKDKKAAYDKEFREGVVNYKKEHPDMEAQLEALGRENCSGCGSSHFSQDLP